MSNAKVFAEREVKIDFSDKNHRKMEEENNHNSSFDGCFICGEIYSEYKNITIISCNHKYHFQCFHIWLTKSTKCPFCSTDVIEQKITPFDIEELRSKIKNEIIEKRKRLQEEKKLKYIKDQEVINEEKQILKKLIDEKIKYFYNLIEIEANCLFERILEKLNFNGEIDDIFFKENCKIAKKKTNFGDICELFDITNSYEANSRKIIISALTQILPKNLLELKLMTFDCFENNKDFSSRFPNSLRRALLLAADQNITWDQISNMERSSLGQLILNVRVNKTFYQSDISSEILEFLKSYEKYPGNEYNKKIANILKIDL